MGAHKCSAAQTWEPARATRLLALHFAEVGQVQARRSVHSGLRELRRDVRQAEARAALQPKALCSTPQTAAWRIALGAVLPASSYTAARVVLPC